jgi:hypothetical protein
MLQSNNAASAIFIFNFSVIVFNGNNDNIVLRCVE